MSPQQKSLLGGAHGNVMACLDTLRRRATYGTRAKPTVADLNDILQRLKNAAVAIEQAVVASEQ